MDSVVFEVPHPMQAPSDLQVLQALHECAVKEGVAVPFSRFRELDAAWAERAEHDHVAAVLFDAHLPQTLAEGRRLIDLLRGLPECVLAAAKRPDLEVLVPHVRRSLLVADRVAGWLQPARSGGKGPWELHVPEGSQLSLRSRGLPWLTSAVLGPDHRPPGHPRRPSRSHSPTEYAAAAIALLLAPGLHYVDLREVQEQPISRNTWREWVGDEKHPFRVSLGLRTEAAGRRSGDAPWNTRLSTHDAIGSWEMARRLLHDFEEKERVPLLLRLHRGLRRRYKVTANDEYHRAALAVATFAAQHLPPQADRSPLRLERAVRQCVAHVMRGRYRGQPWCEALLYRRLAPLLASGSSPAHHRLQLCQLEFEATWLLVWMGLHRNARLPHLDGLDFDQQLEGVRQRANDLNCRLRSEERLSFDRLGTEAMAVRTRKLAGALEVVACGTSAEAIEAIHRVHQGETGSVQLDTYVAAARGGREPPAAGDAFFAPLQQRRHLMREHFVRRKSNELWQIPLGWKRQKGAIRAWLWFLAVGVVAAEQLAARQAPVQTPLTQAGGLGQLAKGCIDAALLLGEPQARPRVNLLLRTLLGLDVRCAAWQSADRSFLRPVWETVEEACSSRGIEHLRRLEEVIEQRYLLVAYQLDPATRDLVVRRWAT